MSLTKLLLSGINPDTTPMAVSFGGCSIGGTWARFVEEPKEPLTSKAAKPNSRSEALERLLQLSRTSKFLEQYKEDAEFIIKEHHNWLNLGSPGDLKERAVGLVDMLRLGAHEEEIPKLHDLGQVTDYLFNIGGKIMGGAAIWRLRGCPDLPKYTDLDFFFSEATAFRLAAKVAEQFDRIDTAFYFKEVYELADLVWCEAFINQNFNVACSAECLKAHKGGRLRHVVNFRNVIRPDRTVLRVGYYMGKYGNLQLPVADMLALLSLWDMASEITTAALHALEQHYAAALGRIH